MPKGKGKGKSKSKSKRKERVSLPSTIKLARAMRAMDKAEAKMKKEKRRHRAWKKFIQPIIELSKYYKMRNRKSGQDTSILGQHAPAFRKGWM